MDSIGFIYAPTTLQHAGAAMLAPSPSASSSLPGNAVVLSSAMPPSPTTDTVLLSSATPPSLSPGLAMRFRGPASFEPTNETTRTPSAASTAPAHPAAQAFCDAAWQVLSVRGSDGRVYGEQAEARRAVHGEPRVNRPYPDPELLAAGLPQGLPLTVTTPFKWLLSPPQVLGDHILFHAQHEGGPGFCDNEELECRDLFIALQRDPATGRYVETGHLQTLPSSYGHVYRSTDPVQAVPGSDHHFLAHIEEGSYSSGIYARHTHLYRIERDAITEVAQWDGHLPATDDRIRQAT